MVKEEKPQGSPHSAPQADLQVRQTHQTVTPNSTDPAQLIQLLTPDSDRKGSMMIIPGL